MVAVIIFFLELAAFATICAIVSSQLQILGVYSFIGCSVAGLIGLAGFTYEAWTEW